MKRKNLNFAMAYVIGVVLPLLGLAGVLRSGCTLTPPVSVGGLWKIQADVNELIIFPCGGSMAIADAGFTISQSGKNFVLDFDDAAMSSTSGRVEGTTLKASMLLTARWVKETKCDEGNVLSLVATVDSSVKPRFLAGVLSVDGCAACAPINFRAIRENLAKAKGSN